MFQTQVRFISEIMHIHSLTDRSLPLVSIQHSEYRYPPSKNPYWTKLQQLKDSVYIDNDTEVHSGNWRNQFKSSNSAPHSSSQPKLHVEIGCNAGHVILEWAKRNPQDLYIGIDWKFKPIFRASEKSSKHNLKNLIFFRAHAERLNYIFGPEEIDSLYLYFPDPWPKKAHWKNRFIHPEQLIQIAKVLKKDGIFHIKTDHPGYFEWMLNAVSQCSSVWKIMELNRNLHENHPAPHTLSIPEVTLFEKLFIRDQIPIQSLKLQRQS